MNSHTGTKLAYSINLDGSTYNETLNFDFGNKTEISRSCSLQWQNQYYIFGGGIETRQVSKVTGYRLEREATLDFDFGYGACTVLNQATIVLCFSDVNLDHDAKLCRQSNNPLGSFTHLPESIYYHRETKISSFDGKNEN